MPVGADDLLVMLTPQPQKAIEAKLSPKLRTIISASVLKTITDSSFGLKFKLHGQTACIKIFLYLPKAFQCQKEKGALGFLCKADTLLYKSKY